MALQQKWLAHIVEKPLTNVDCVRDIFEIVQHDEELIATLTSKRISLPNRPAQPLTDHLQKSVPKFMPQSLVDLVKVIQTDATGGKRFTLTLGGDHSSP